MAETLGIALASLVLFCAIRFIRNWMAEKPAESVRVPVIPEGDWRSLR